LRAIDDVAASSAAEVLVAEVQFDCWAAALTNERWSRISEACFNPLEAEGLHSITVMEFYHVIGNPHIGNVRITKADTRCDVSFVIARNIEIVDVDVRQCLCDWALFGAAMFTLVV
jgi:hypothetical protein